jgi:hypothetical protein
MHHACCSSMLSAFRWCASSRLFQGAVGAGVKRYGGVDSRRQAFSTLSVPQLGSCVALLIRESAHPCMSPHSSLTVRWHPSDTRSRCAGGQCPARRLSISGPSADQTGLYVVTVLKRHSRTLASCSIGGGCVYLGLQPL